MVSILRNPLTVWFAKYLNSRYIEYKNRRKSLKIGYLSYSKNCEYGRYNTLYNYVSIKNSSLDDFSYISDRTRVQNAIIGKFCCIGPDSRIGLGKHPASVFVSTHPIFYSVEKHAQISFVESNFYTEIGNIIIGNDVWIGSNVIVADGVTIADGVIVAAGSVVTKNVPAYAIVGGIPARIIKYRFDNDEIDMLLKFKWWDHNLEFLKKNCSAFHDIKELRNILSVK